MLFSNLMLDRCTRAIGNIFKPKWQKIERVTLKQSYFVWLPVETPLYLLMQMARTSFTQIMCVGDRIRLHLLHYIIVSSQFIILMLYIVFDMFGVENMYIQEKDCYIIKNSFVLVSIEMHNFTFPGGLRICITYSKLLFLSLLTRNRF